MGGECYRRFFDLIDAVLIQKQMTIFNVNIHRPDLPEGSRLWIGQQHRDSPDNTLCGDQGGIPDSQQITNFIGQKTSHQSFGYNGAVVELGFDLNCKLNITCLRNLFDRSFQPAPP